MKNFSLQQVIIYISLIFSVLDNAMAQNPFICNQFTDDPTARVFNG
jgi:hypothetical protein